jgi:hypothetical protein
MVVLRRTLLETRFETLLKARFETLLEARLEVFCTTIDGISFNGLQVSQEAIAFLK